MAESRLKVLLVEDNPGDARLVTEMLRGEYGDEFEIVQATRLEDAIDILSLENFDAVLLDLSLPDSSGVETIDQTHGTDPGHHTPIIVITGRYGERDALASMQHGAQDFLTKSSLNPQALVRSIRFAVERRRSRQRAEEAESADRSAREIQSLESIQAPATTMITARSYGMGRLSDAAPDTFAEIVDQYRGLIDAAIEERGFRVEGHVSQGLRLMAQRLGFLRASPRDIVDMHLMAMKSIHPNKMSTSYVVAEEARLMLIELMGDLAAYYRDHMLPVGRPRVEGAPNPKRGDATS